MKDTRRRELLLPLCILFGSACEVEMKDTRRRELLQSLYTSLSYPADVEMKDTRRRELLHPSLILFFVRAAQ